MRHISKSTSPRELEDWKAQRNENWEPCWGNFRGEEKKAVRKALIVDQGYICCYCGDRIYNDITTEIEHINPRTFCKDEDEKIDYANMLASCHGGRKKENGKNAEPLPDRLSCNARRGEKNLGVSPLNPNCEEKFLFTRDGQILPNDENDNDTDETIKTLGLHIERLINKRRGVLKPFLSIDKASAIKVIQHFSHQHADGDFDGYKPFNFTVINYLKKKFSISNEDILV
ncbi:retron system putative HNH endonuclease [Bacillus bombysepticus]